MEKILLIEDDADEQQTVGAVLRDRGYEVMMPAAGKSASRLLAQIPDLIVSVLGLSGRNGLVFLREARQALPDIPLVVIANHGAFLIASGVESMAPEVLDCSASPMDQEDFLHVIRRAAGRSQLQRDCRRLRQEVDQRNGFSGMVGSSEPMRRVYEQIQLVAPTRSTILITGESGTGKELVARAIHQVSPRASGPFVVLNCGAIPKDLAESEIFGHIRGAFTGAIEHRIGRFEAAHRGTLLIDEIGEMELPVQAKLLRTLETHTISPIGSNIEQLVDVRVLAATHRDLRSLVEAGKFREDLYYRLHVVHLDLPPLRQRREDIPLLESTFLEQLNKEHGRNVREVSLDAMDALKSYSWPGNVRELRNVLEGILVLLRKEDIDLADLPHDIRGIKNRETKPAFQPGIRLRDLEREAIQECLIQLRGRRLETAKQLGISTRTLLRKIREYDLTDPRRRSAVAGIRTSRSS